MVTECFFNLFLEVFSSKELEQLEFKFGKKYWDLETCRKSYKKYVPNFILGCGVTKELFLEQAKKKVTKLEEDLSKSKKKSDLEISHYRDTALKWKNRTLHIQQKIQPCLQCKVHVQDYSKK